MEIKDFTDWIKEFAESPEGKALMDEINAMPADSPEFIMFGDDDETEELKKQIAEKDAEIERLRDVELIIRHRRYHDDYELRTFYVTFSELMSYKGGEMTVPFGIDNNLKLTIEANDRTKKAQEEKKGGG